MRNLFITAALICLFSGTAYAHDLPDEQPVSYVKSDCKGKFVRPVTEQITRPATVEQITKPERMIVQQAHKLQVIHRPNYFWAEVTPPTDIEAGYIPDPVPVYANTYIPGTYEWQNDELFELQPRSYDVIKRPSGPDGKRRVAAVTAMKKKWVQTSPGRVEKVITGYIQPPPAIAGGKLVNKSLGVYTERNYPAVSKVEMIVTGQVRTPAVIEQSYGACMAKLNMNNALE